MFQATTIVAVKKDDQVAMAGDGQVTFGENTVLKHGANKVRRLYGNKVDVYKRQGLNHLIRTYNGLNRIPGIIVKENRLFSSESALGLKKIVVSIIA